MPLLGGWEGGVRGMIWIVGLGRPSSSLLSGYCGLRVAGHGWNSVLFGIVKSGLVVFAVCRRRGALILGPRHLG